MLFLQELCHQIELWRIDHSSQRNLHQIRLARELFSKKDLRSSDDLRSLEGCYCRTRRRIWTLQSALSMLWLAHYSHLSHWGAPNKGWSYLICLQLEHFVWLRFPWCRRSQWHWELYLRAEQPPHRKSPLGLFLYPLANMGIPLSWISDRSVGLHAKPE